MAGNSKCDNKYLFADFFVHFLADFFKSTLCQFFKINISRWRIFSSQPLAEFSQLSRDQKRGGGILCECL